LKVGVSVRGGIRKMHGASSVLLLEGIAEGELPVVVPLVVLHHAVRRLEGEAGDLRLVEEDVLAFIEPPVGRIVLGVPVLRILGCFLSCLLR